MFALAYVLLEPNFSSLQGSLDVALAPFRRGGIHDFPKAQLDRVSKRADTSLLETHGP